VEILLFGALALFALGAVGLGLKLIAGILRLALELVLLPFHLLGVALALVGGLLALPFLLVAAVGVGVAVIVGALLLPLLPLVLLVLAGLGLASLLRRRGAPRQHST